MVAVTTEGLRANGATADELLSVQWAIATGLADALEGAYSEPITTLTDGLILGLRAGAANVTATPSFSPDGLTAHTIVKEGGNALVPGDIAGDGHELLLRYNLANTRWELLNPHDPESEWAIASGTVDAITATYSVPVMALTDGMLLGFRSLEANTSTTPTFSPDGLTAHTITKMGGAALVPGDIPGANYEAELRYNLTNTRWELLNPAIAPGVLFKALTADDTGGANVNTAQPWFPTAGAVSVAALTAYEFEGQLFLSRAAGTTSHTTSVLFGGTATLTSIDYLAQCKEGDANDLQDMSGFWSSAATALVVKAASTSATEQFMVRLKGIIRINAAGTLIPQFQYSAAPGGAPTVKRGSFFVLRPLGLNTIASQGAWA